MNVIGGDKLWDFAVKLYDLDDIQEHSLMLQNEYSININVLLLCVWCGMEGKPIDEQQLTEALLVLVDWNTQVTQPLRQVRFNIKQMQKLEIANEKDACYRVTKDVELLVEGVEITLLQQLSETWPTQSSQVVAQNVDCYLGKMNVPAELIQNTKDMVSRSLKKFPR